MQGRALLAKIDLNDLLDVVPGASRVGHKNGLEQTKKRESNQVTNEKIRIEKGQCERERKNHDEDVDHSLLRVDRANLDHLLAVGDRCLSSVEFEIFLDEHHRAISTGDNRLRACAG